MFPYLVPLSMFSNRKLHRKISKFLLEEESRMPQVKKEDLIEKNLIENTNKGTKKYGSESKL
jgi:hypothetical protein